MLLKFRCPKCRAEIPLSDDQLREFLVCQHCGQKLRVPERRVPEGYAEALKAKEDFASSFSYKVAFKPAPVRTAAAAVNVASQNDTYQPAPVGSDEFHQVSYKPWSAAGFLELVSLLSGSECKTFFNDEEVPFHELRPSLACLRVRYSSRDRDSYCRGSGRWGGAIFLCRKSGITNDGPQPWIYSHCSKSDDGKFRLQVPGFTAMLNERLSEFRYCPFAWGAFLRKAIARLEEHFEAQTTPYARFLHPEFHADLPDLRVKNTTRGELCQRVYVFTDHCLECAAQHGTVHDGTGRDVPHLPIHEGCHCLDLPVSSGEFSRGYRKFAELLPLLSKEEQVSLVGGELAELVRIGLPTDVILDGAAVRPIADIAPELNLFAVAELSTNGELSEKVKELKGPKEIKHDEKEWVRLVSELSRSHDEPEAREIAARTLISQRTRRARR